MKIFLFITILIAEVVSNTCLAQVLIRGTNLSLEGVTTAQKFIGWDLDDIIDGEGVRVISYTNLGAGDKYFSLSNLAQIYFVDFSEKKKLGSWGLSGYTSYFLESELVDKSIQQTNRLSATASVGCFKKSPLRYGDLEQDGRPELVIFLGNDWQSDMVVFSTEVKKVIFSANLEVDHSYVLQDEDINIEEEDGTIDQNPLYAEYSSPEYFQYITGQSTGPIYDSDPGYRAYGKIFFGEFDDDPEKAPDIILWHKYYESRLNKDPLIGFKKVSDTFIHYKLINGEYQKQATPEETIKSWLAAKQLTWQKGYPSKSECPGQEGQLIPEMHDPLLNDPDVLQ